MGHIKTRQLRQIQIKELDDYLIQNNLKVQNKFRPIAYIIKQIKENNCDQKPRSVKKTLEFLADLVEAYIKAQSNENLEDFMHQRILSAYGMLQIANRNCESWIISIRTHEDKDERLKIFSKFLGLDGAVTQLPKIMFKHYLYMLRIAKITISEIFQKEQRQKLMISYTKLHKALKEQVSD